MISMVPAYDAPPMDVDEDVAPIARRVLLGPFAVGASDVTQAIDAALLVDDAGSRRYLTETIVMDRLGQPRYRAFPRVAVCSLSLPRLKGPGLPLG